MIQAEESDNQGPGEGQKTGDLDSSTDPAAHRAQSVLSHKPGEEPPRGQGWSGHLTWGSETP